MKKYLRKVYSMNPKRGNYCTVGYPPQISKYLSDYVLMEVKDGEIIITPREIKPRPIGV